MKIPEKGIYMLWTNVSTQDLKANEPRLRDINKVADDLLFEKLLTPEGAQIRQVCEGPSMFPQCQAEFWASTFRFDTLDALVHRSARTGRR